MNELYDNLGTSFEVGLQNLVTESGVKRVDFCTGYFNLRGWAGVADAVESLEGAEIRENGKTIKRFCRLLIGMHRQPFELVQQLYTLSFSRQMVDNSCVRRWKAQVVEDLHRQLTLGFQTKHDETVLQRLLAQLKANKVTVKLHLSTPLHAKLYLAYRPEDVEAPVRALMGSSNLTLGGLSRNGELNAKFAEPPEAERFAKWFSERWKDRFSLDITQDLIELLEKSWAALPKPMPYEIYLRVMYELSQEARQGISDYTIPDPFDKELFDYQKTAVLLLMRHLAVRHGAMLGDVVGLGKTISACAIAKAYELNGGYSTLVLCPPKLIPMWKHYEKHYELKMHIRSHASGLNEDRDRRYKLIIIDESHNLRNAAGQRYGTIKDFIAEREECHVLLLTATPYNKDYQDIGAQLGLFLDPDQDLGIRPERAIAACGGEQGFARVHPQAALSSLNAFELSNSADDWRDLLKLYLVRRTRTFIKENYAHVDENDPTRFYLLQKDGTRNYFPARIPKSVTFKTTPGDIFERMYSEPMMDELSQLHLPRYGLSNYLEKSLVEKASPTDRKALETLTSAGSRLMGFCRSNFCKRMDSSGVAFLISLYRHAVRNAMYLYAIRNGLDLPFKQDLSPGYGWDEEDSGGHEETKLVFPTDSATYERDGEELYRVIKADAPKSVLWLSSKYFTGKLASALEEDIERILKMLRMCGPWIPREDEKLNALEQLVSKKHSEEKILIFTQFADTARYLARQLKSRGIDRIEEIDGDSENITEAVCAFSPTSNHINPPPRQELQTRILIATDTLSEGQNLQDSHIVVNYDLPWAIIRLIQRAGRVDRIGQRSKSVWCYSFFPQEGVDEIIRLTERLKERFNANADAIGSDEIFFEGTKQNLMDVYNEKSGILDDDPNASEVDLASQAYQIWEQATKNNEALAERVKNLPTGAYSAKSAGTFGTGAIAYAKTRNDCDLLVWVDAQGNVKSYSPVAIFEALACSPETPSVPPLADHLKIVNQGIEASVAEGNNATAGILGNRNTSRRRLHTLLKERVHENEGGLFAATLSNMADAVFRAPLRESARNRLGLLFRRKATPDEILDVAQALYEDDKLCVPSDDDFSPTAVAVCPICSLGLVE